MNSLDLGLHREPEETIQSQLAELRGRLQEDRVTDTYINEAMELDRYKSELERLGQRRRELEQVAQDIEGRELHHQDSKKAMTCEERRQLLRLLVEHIIVEDGTVRIEPVTPPKMMPFNCVHVVLSLSKGEPLIVRQVRLCRGSRPRLLRDRSSPRAVGYCALV